MQRPFFLSDVVAEAAMAEPATRHTGHWFKEEEQSYITFCNEILFLPATDNKQYTKQVLPLFPLTLS